MIHFIQYSKVLFILDYNQIVLHIANTHCGLAIVAAVRHKKIMGKLQIEFSPWCTMLAGT